MCVSVCEAEGDSPISAHSDRPDSLSGSLHFVQAVSRAGKIERACGGIEHRQDVRNPDSEGRINEASLTLFKHLLESFVPETGDHGLIVQ